MFGKSRNAVRDMHSKESRGITIPLKDYADFVAKETMLEQVAHAVAKDDSDFGTIANLKAILQMDAQKKEEGS